MEALQGFDLLSVGSLRHRVTICAWTEEPDQDISIIRKRPGVFEAWAKVMPIKASRVFDTRVAFGDQNAPTHEIIIRRPSDTFITSKHWVFTETRGAQRWFRVHATQDIEERGCYTQLMVREHEIKDERSDPATHKQPKNFETPMTLGAKVSL